MFSANDEWCAKPTTGPLSHTNTAVAFPVTVGQPRTREFPLVMAASHSGLRLAIHQRTIPSPQLQRPLVQNCPSPLNFNAALSRPRLMLPHVCFLCQSPRRGTGFWQIHIISGKSSRARRATIIRHSGTPDFTAAGKGSASAFSDLEENVECIGTGTDVECVIPYTEDSIKVGNKVATRAVNSERMSTRKELRIDSLSDVPLDTGPEEFNSFGEQQIDSIDHRSLLKDILEFIVLISPFFFWGTAMVAMKGVVPKAGPLFVAATRLIPSGFILLVFATYKGKKHPAGFTAWLAVTLFALIDASCFQGFLAEGLKRTSAGLGSVIIDSQPLTVAILASLFFGETIGALGIIGLATGVIGLLLLEVPVQVIDNFLKSQGFDTLMSSAALSMSISDRSGWTVWDSGEWWMLLAAQSMAVGTVMVRWVSQFSDPVMATGWHMVLGGLPLLALATIQQDSAVAGHILDLQFADWLALAYISVFGSAMSYGVFFYNATRGSLTKLSSLTFLTPMFAALFGYLLLDETLSTVQIMGALITLASIYLVNTRASSGNKESN